MALPKTLSEDEVTSLMAAPNMEAPTGLRNRCLLELMYRSGLRVGEACGLHLRDVDWRNHRIKLRAEITKGGKGGVAYLDRHTEELLREWKGVRQRELRQRGASSKFLLCTLRGGPVSRQYAWQMMQRYGRRAGLETHVFPHILRHTFATKLLTEGTHIVKVQRLLRHSDVRTTSVYEHLADADLSREAWERDW